MVGVLTELKQACADKDLHAVRNIAPLQSLEPGAVATGIGDRADELLPVLANVRHHHFSQCSLLLGRQPAHRRATVPFEHLPDLLDPFIDRQLTEGCPFAGRAVFEPRGISQHGGEQVVGVGGRRDVAEKLPNSLLAIFVKFAEAVEVGQQCCRFIGFESDDMLSPLAA